MGGRCHINVTNYPNVLQIKAEVILNNYLWRLLARNTRFYSTILHAAYQLFTGCCHKTFKLPTLPINHYMLPRVKLAWNKQKDIGNDKYDVSCLDKLNNSRTVMHHIRLKVLFSGYRFGILLTFAPCMLAHLLINPLPNDLICKLYFHTSCTFKLIRYFASLFFIGFFMNSPECCNKWFAGKKNFRVAKDRFCYCKMFPWTSTDV